MSKITKKSKQPYFTSKYIEKNNGKGYLECEYDQDFINLVKDQLVLIKEPTKKQISAFIIKKLKEAIIKKELSYLLDMVDGDYMMLYEVLTQSDWREKQYLNFLKKEGKGKKWKSEL